MIYAKSAYLLLTIVPLLLCGKAVAQSNSTNAPMEGVVAVVNDQVISFSDVRNRARMILLSLNVEPDEQTLLQARARAVRSLIDEYLQIQEASRFELTATKDEIDAQLDYLAEQNGFHRESFLADLENKGVNPASLRQQILAEIVWRKLISGRYGQRVRVSELQVDDVISRMQRNMELEQFRVAEILLQPDDETPMQEIINGAWSLYRQLMEGAPFQLVAQQFSTSPTAAAGGDLGWITRADLPEQLAAQLDQMTSSSISEPIQTEDGIYILALLDKKSPASEQDLMVQLGQLAAFGEKASQRLASVRDDFSSCADFDDVSNSNIVASNLGEIKLDSLSAKVRKAVMAAQIGGWTEPIPIGSNGIAMMLVCSRISNSNISLPDRTIVENRLFEQHMLRLSDRYLRDLRRQAAIVQPRTTTSADAAPS